MIHPRVQQALRSVIDPEMGVNVVDLGLIYRGELRNGEAVVEMTMTSPACPMVGWLQESCEEALWRWLPDVESVTVSLVWEPRWTSAQAATAVQRAKGWTVTARPGFPRHLILMVAAMVALVTGLASGLQRLGWGVPAPSVWLHGPLMVGGFLGTLIGLERALALKALGPRWGFAAPAFCAMAGLGWLGGAPMTPSLVSLLLGSLLQVAVFLRLGRVAPHLPLRTMTAGAICFAVGNGMLVANVSLSVVVLWWVVYLALTIAGERLELSAHPAKHEPFFTGLCFLALGAAALGLVNPNASYSLLGVALTGLATWLTRHDGAKANLSGEGLPRYAAWSIYLAYLWLAVAGLAMTAIGSAQGGPLYDLELHAFFVGFVFSMILAHGPIIFPVLTGRGLRFTRWFYGPLAALHLSLILRVVGVLGSHVWIRQAGGLGNALSVLAFLALVVYSIRKSPDA